MVVETLVDLVTAEAQIEALPHTIGRKCIRPFVLNVEENAKCLLNQTVVDQFTAVIVLRLKVEEKTDRREIVVQTTKLILDQISEVTPDRPLMLVPAMMVVREI